MIEALLDFYKEKQVEIARDHQGEFVLIHSSKIIGFYPGVREAYLDAVEERNFEPGHFLIRQCVLPEDEVPLTFYSRLG